MCNVPPTTGRAGGVSHEVGFAQVVVSDRAVPATPPFRVEVGAVIVRVPHGLDGNELCRLVAALC